MTSKLATLYAVDSSPTAGTNSSLQRVYLKDSPTPDIARISPRKTSA